MKSIKCRLIIHGSTKEIDMGEFPSISSAKQYIKDLNWFRPHTIRPYKGTIKV